jgi:hypothetical protein
MKVDKTTKQKEMQLQLIATKVESTLWLTIQSLSKLKLAPLRLGRELIIHHVLFITKVSSVN